MIIGSPTAIIQIEANNQNPEQIYFHIERLHISITKINDNINMDSAIAGSMNDNINMDSAIAGSMSADSKLTTS